MSVSTKPLAASHVRFLTHSRLLGESAGFWCLFALVVFAAALSPAFISTYDLLNLNNFLIPVFLALGLSLIWGHVGILSLGQSGFYGVGGYAYGITAINFIEGHGNTNLALLVGILVPVAFALLLGFIMFYARLQGVYVAIILLVVTLVIETFMNQTASSVYKIGNTYLGGNNGLGRFSADVKEIPSLTLGFGDTTRTFLGSDRAFFYLIVGLLALVFLALRWLLRSRWGYIMAAIREDPVRTETFGYDVRRIQLGVFALAAALAALSGIFYVSWGNFITPNVFGVTANILPVVWVAVGGRKSLAGVVVATVALSWLSQRLAIQGDYAYLILGLILITTVMLMPEGVAPGTRRAWRAAKAFAHSVAGQRPLIPEARGREMGREREPLDGD